MTAMTSASEQYFSATPASPEHRRLLTVPLAGREVEIETSSGVFSQGRLDPGTAVLLRHEPPLPGPVDGTGLEVLDLGCGWGPIALTLALRRPQARVWAVDVNERALSLTAANAERLALDRDGGYVVAAHRFTAQTEPLLTGERLFTFRTS